jgi:hypothetical protein
MKDKELFSCAQYKTLTLNLVCQLIADCLHSMDSLDDLIVDLKDNITYQTDTVVSWNLTHIETMAMCSHQEHWRVYSCKNNPGHFLAVWGWGASVPQASVIVMDAKVSKMMAMLKRQSLPIGMVPSISWQTRCRKPRLFCSERERGTSQLEVWRHRISLALDQKLHRPRGNTKFEHVQKKLRCNW